MFNTIFYIPAALFLVLSTVPINSAHAQLQNESLVVIDSALNADQSKLSGNIIYEVCILDWSACPNGQNFMEGKGSAYLQPRFMGHNGFNHGTQMVSSALRTNPNLQIVFIRIVANSSAGSRLNVSPVSVARALKWVSENKEKFKIGAVAMSQGHHNLSKLTKYCPHDSSVESMIELLLQNGIPFFVPAGNSRDYERIDWPACNPSAISIGALDINRNIASYGNIDRDLLDFFEIGEQKVLDHDGLERIATGTSVSAQIAAAKWMKIIELNPSKSYDQRMSMFVNSSFRVSNKYITNALALPIEIQDPEIKIQLSAELDQIRLDLQVLMELLLMLISASRN